MIMRDPPQAPREAPDCLYSKTQATWPLHNSPVHPFSVSLGTQELGMTTITQRYEWTKCCLPPPWQDSGEEGMSSESVGAGRGRVPSSY